MNEFDKKAKDWNMNPVHIERSQAIAEYMINLIPLSNKMRALELGAGTGVLSFLLKDRFSDNQQGFSNLAISPCFVIRKVTSADKTKEYPVFLLTAFR